MIEETEYSTNLRPAEELIPPVLIDEHDEVETGMQRFSSQSKQIHSLQSGAAMSSQFWLEMRSTVTNVRHQRITELKNDVYETNYMNVD